MREGRRRGDTAPRFPWTQTNTPASPCCQSVTGRPGPGCSVERPSERARERERERECLFGSVPLRTQKGIRGPCNNTRCQALCVKGTQSQQTPAIRSLRQRRWSSLGSFSDMFLLQFFFAGLSWQWQYLIWPKGGDVALSLSLPPSLPPFLLSPHSDLSYRWRSSSSCL